MNIPPEAILRFPSYARVLNELLRAGLARVSPAVIAQALGADEACVARNLACLRCPCTNGNYALIDLLEELQKELKLDRIWPVLLVGVGHLGQALLKQRAFPRKGFDICLAFDCDEDLIGQKVYGVKVNALSELPSLAREQDVKIAILAVPMEEAQALTNLLTAADLRVIINYSWAELKVPEGVYVHQIDPLLFLEQTLFKL